MNASLLCIILLVVSRVGIAGSSKSGRRDDLQGNVYTETVQYTADILSSTYDWLSGSSNQCPFHENTMTSIKDNLVKHIKGQDEGLGTILNAISGWEFQRQSGYGEPLVLALTGPTGVGKSETAFRIAEGALMKRRRVGKSLKYLPNGLLTLRGEDYVRGDLAEIHEAIRSRIVEHLEMCGGNAVIVFDEVQKVLPGTLEVLMPALESRGSISRTQHVPVSSASGYSAAGMGGAQAILTTTAVAASEMVNYMSKSLFSAVSKEKKGAPKQPSTDKANTADKGTTRTKTVTTQHSTENVIFIFISDIGAEKMTKLVLTYGNRSAIPQTLLRSEIKSALDDQWARLRFGKVVREVVPYLPLEPEHIREILRTKLHNTARDFQYSYWADLVVDEDVVSYLSSPPLVKYSVYNARAPAGAGAGAGGTASAGKQHVPARGAAAQVQSQSRNGNQGTGSGGAAGGEGGDSAGQAAECAVGGGGGAGDCSRQPSSSAGNMGTNGQGPAPSAPSTTKIFATWGARSLENAGPLQDLRSVLNRYTQPWRPDQVLHVGLVSEANRELRNAKWGIQEKAGSTASGKVQTQLYMQWCKVDQLLHNQCSGSSGENNNSTTSATAPGTASSGDTGVGAKAGRSTNARTESDQCVGTTPIITNEIAFSAACETVWFGALVA